MPSSLTTLLPPALGFSPHPPVSVYGTGTYGAIAAFLDSMYPDFATIISLPVTPLAYCADLPAQRLLCLDRSFLSRLPLTPRVPTVLTICSTGISTCCPSATSSDLALGPDLPRADQLYPGILGYSANRILTYFSLLIPAFSLLNSPRLLTVTLRRVKNAPLPNHQPCASPTLEKSLHIWLFSFRQSVGLTISTASVSCFSPGHFRRRDSRLVSCYALFECLAASEPTS